MKERPILFSGPMVRAILDGRKTQTRRVVKNTGLYAIDARYHGPIAAQRELSALATQCPYGQHGDRLWVRETWRPEWDEAGTGFFVTQYKATDETGEGRWRPSIHMPHTLSRITLEIEEVRVERLNEISEEDARAEGIDGWNWDGDVLPFVAANQHLHPAVLKYAMLWESINGPESWDANPWVWVVTFRRV